MSEEKQLFSASLAKDAVYKTGLRSFMEYRDLGIENATHGTFRRPHDPDQEGSGQRPRSAHHRACISTTATSRCSTC